jgi:hypothetical protein
MWQPKQVAESPQSSIQKFQYLYNVRRVTSNVRALAALMKDWKCVIAEKDNAPAVTKGLLRQLTDFECIHIPQFLLDHLGRIKNLSLIFQWEEPFPVTVEWHIKNAMTLLESLKCNPEENENKFVKTHHLMESITLTTTGIKKHCYVFHWIWEVEFNNTRSERPGTTILVSLKKPQ